MSSGDNIGDVETDKDTVLGLRKGLAILASFNANRSKMSSSEAADLVGITRAAARRALLTLTQIGYTRFDGKYFHLQPRVLELGYTYLATLRIPELLQPSLDNVSDIVRESCSAAVLEGNDVVYIARSAKKRLMSIDIGVGTRLPAYCTSLGRVLLAYRDKEETAKYIASGQFETRTPLTITDPADLHRLVAGVRENGFAVVDEELEIGLRSMAIPVFDTRNECICAMNISASSARISTDEMKNDILPHLLKEQEILRRFIRL